MTRSGIPSRDISTAWACRSWWLCRRRHKHQYADLWVMPTTPGELLHEADLAVGKVGVIRGVTGRLG
jgi:hypothetical protein